jgi:hypothetical protein
LLQLIFFQVKLKQIIPTSDWWNHLLDFLSLQMFNSLIIYDLIIFYQPSFHRPMYFFWQIIQFRLNDFEFRSSLKVFFPSSHFLFLTFASVWDKLRKQFWELIKFFFFFFFWQSQCGLVCLTLLLMDSKVRP